MESKRQFKRHWGILTVAQTGPVDYLRLAYLAAMSLKLTQPSNYSYLSVVVEPDRQVPDSYLWAFDEVIRIPWGDAAANSIWKLENEWKLYHISPYQHTVKIDADMLFTSDISHRWRETLEPVWFTNRVFNHQDHPIDDMSHRPYWKTGRLPNIYSAMMGWSWSDQAEIWFNTAGAITDNWADFMTDYWGEVPLYSTDLCYAIVADILGGYAPVSDGFVHMRSELTPGATPGTPWHHNINLTPVPGGEVYVGKYLQTLPLHYHEKAVITSDIIQHYQSQCYEFMV